MYIQMSQSKDQTVQKPVRKTIDVVNTTYKLDSKFSAAFVWAVNSKKHHTKKSYFCPSDNNVVHAPRDKQTESDVKRLKLNQMKGAYKQQFKIRCDVDGIFIDED